ncbi:MAG: peptidoglycan-binding domain-containing protein [Pseudomonadota bacterium]
MSENMDDRSAIGGEWLIAFAGLGLASALVSVFLLTDPYWKLASIGAPVDETTMAVAELFDHDGEELDEEKRIEFAFADVLLEPDPRLIARRGPAVLETPAVTVAPSAPDGLDRFVRRAGVREIEGPSRFETLEILAKVEAPRGYDADLIEEKMELSPGKRRNVQLRLALAGHNPRGVDGIFGPDTRDAIAAFQAELGAEETGYLDPPLLAALEAETGEAYAEWRQRREIALLASVTPMPRPEVQEEAEGRCVRDQSGEVIAFQGIICDLTGLRESLFRLEFASNTLDGERLASLETAADR